MAESIDDVLRELEQTAPSARRGLYKNLYCFKPPPADAMERLISLFFSAEDNDAEYVRGYLACHGAKIDRENLAHLCRLAEKTESPRQLFWALDLVENCAIELEGVDPLVRRSLGHDAAVIRKNAAIFLRKRMPERVPEFVDDLVGALDIENDWVSHEVKKTCGGANRPLLVEALKKHARSSASDESRGGAALLLCDIFRGADDEVDSIVAEFSQAKSSALRAVGTKLKGERAGAAGSEAQLQALLDALKDKNAKVRLEAATALLRAPVDDARVRQAILGLAVDKKPDMRRVAAGWLRRAASHADECFPALLKLLGDTDRVVVHASAESLMAYGDRRAEALGVLPKAIETVRNRECNFRILKAVQDLGDARLPVLMAMALHGSHQDDRGTAMLELSDFPDRAGEIEPVLLQALAGDKAARPRLAAAVALARLGGTMRLAGFDQLEREATNSHGPDRRAAAMGLKALRGEAKSAIPALVTAVTFPTDPDDRSWHESWNENYLEPGRALLAIGPEGRAALEQALPNVPAQVAAVVRQLL